MATFTFSGNYVGANNSANDDGSGRACFQLDPARDLDGIGDFPHNAIDPIIFADKDNNKLSGSGADTLEGHADFFIDGIKLYFLDPIHSVSSAGSQDVGRVHPLNVTPRVKDVDIDRAGAVFVQDSNRTDLAPMRSREARPGSNGQLIEMETRSW